MNHCNVKQYLSKIEHVNDRENKQIKRKGIHFGILSQLQRNILNTLNYNAQSYLKRLSMFYKSSHGCITLYNFLEHVFFQNCYSSNTFLSIIVVTSDRLNVKFVTITM